MAAWEEDKVIIAVPCSDDKGLESGIFAHFGRCPYFFILDTETKDERVIPNTSEHLGGEGTPPALLANEGVTVLICEDLGRRAIMELSRLGIGVYVGANGTAGDAIEAWSKNELKSPQDEYACKGHSQIGD